LAGYSFNGCGIKLISSIFAFSCGRWRLLRIVVSLVLALRVFIVTLILFIQRLLLLGFGAVVSFLIIVWWKGQLDIPCFARKIKRPGRASAAAVMQL
jgi:hypothetical protein